jgi:GNAT superfamily N-acetyltransferase
VITKLFGGNGACGGCWCMWWRVPRGGKLWEEAKGQRNRETFQRLVEHGQVNAIVAFAGDEPVGWCSFGPRQTFPRLKTVRALKTGWTEGTWSIVCFFVRSGWRGRGIGTRMIKAATDRAFELGAQEIEGYPVAPKTPSAPIPHAFAWTGVPALFQAAGYQEKPVPKGSRPVFIKRR